MADHPSATRGLVRKSGIIFVAFLPQFIDRSDADATAQLMTLGLLFSVLATIRGACWVVAASSARAWLGRSSQRLGMFRAAGGVMMIIFGVGLAFTGRPASSAR
jgi:threonine/homoserine/homoserine lactone efflux protein